MHIAVLALTLIPVDLVDSEVLDQEVEEALAALAAAD